MKTSQSVRRAYLFVLGLSALLVSPSQAAAYWHPVEADLGFWGAAMAVYDGDLVVGGLIPHGITKWNGSSWRPLGEGMPRGYPSCLAVHDGTLIAAGSFIVAGADTANYIAAWDGSSWAPLAGGMDGCVSALTAYGGNLVAGGGFTRAGATEAAGVAQWDGVAWKPLGGGIDGSVSALAVYHGALIAAGHFTQAGGVVAENIAQWDGASWHPLGTGISAPFSEVGWAPAIWALTVYGERLIAAGIFSRAGDIPVRNIAQWDGADWSALGAGISGGAVVDGAVGALEVYDGKLIAAGLFDRAGGIAAANIAQWDGADWRAMENGLDFGALGLATYYGSLFVVGAFEKASGIDTRYIARWDGHPFDPVSEFPPAQQDDGASDGDVVQLPSPSQDEMTDQILQAATDNPRAALIAATVPKPSPRLRPLLDLSIRGTTISFMLDATTHGSVDLYDIQGRSIRTLERGLLGFGKQEIFWDGRDRHGSPAPSGIYYCRVQTVDQRGTRPLLLIK